MRYWSTAGMIEPGVLIGVITVIVQLWQCKWQTGRTNPGICGAPICVGRPQHPEKVRCLNERGYVKGH